MLLSILWSSRVWYHVLFIVGMYRHFGGTFASIFSVQVCRVRNKLNYVGKLQERWPPQTQRAVQTNKSREKGKGPFQGLCRLEVGCEKWTHFPGAQMKGVISRGGDLFFLAWSPRIRLRSDTTLKTTICLLAGCEVLPVSEDRQGTFGWGMERHCHSHHVLI
jgi:hypothetical protein